MTLWLLSLQNRRIFLPEVSGRFGLVRGRNVSGVVLFGAFNGDRRNEGGGRVAVLVRGDLAPGVGAAGVRAGDVICCFLLARVWIAAVSLMGAGGGDSTS
jgi:hypothetical protein